MTQIAFDYLMKKKIPFIKNTTTGKWLTIKITKRGNYFYANGKRICKNMINELEKVGA